MLCASSRCSDIHPPPQEGHRAKCNVWGGVTAIRKHYGAFRALCSIPLYYYTLRRPVMGEVLSTRIWGVPSVGRPLL